MLKTAIDLDKNELNLGISLLAVSGGMDSMALWHFFETQKLPYAIAHCNFGLRNTESDAETTLVKSIAEERNCKIHFIQFTKDNFNPKLSTQQAARELRYAFLNELKTTFNYARIVTAHHAKDNLEHLLIYLSRNNTNLALEGIESNIHTFYRPFIKTHKEDIETYVAKNSILYLNDSSNDKTIYLRNKFRHLLVPFLNDNNLLKDLEIANKVQLVLTKKLEKSFKKSCFYFTDTSFILKKKQSNIPLLTHFLNTNNWHYKEVKKAITLQKGAVLSNKTNNLFATENYWIYLAIQPLPIRKNIEIGETTLHLPVCNLKIQTNVALTVDFYQPHSGLSIKTKVGNKKVSKLLTDLKIPSMLKPQIPIILCKNEVLAVGNFAFSDTFEAKNIAIIIEWNPFFTHFLKVK